MENQKSIKKINYSTLFFLLTTILLAFTLIIVQRKDKTRGYDSSSILTRITYLQELALVKYNYTGVIGYKDHMKILSINIPLTDKYFLLKYNGYLKAGIDFQQIKVNVIDEKTVHVSIPKPQIFDTVIDENSIQVYNESENAFNPIKISDYNEAISREKNGMIQDAIKNGVYKDATTQAKLAITSLLKEMGFEDIKITEEIIIPQQR